MVPYKRRDKLKNTNTNKINPLHIITMKYLIAVLTLIAQLALFLPLSLFAQEEGGHTFLVTAYYSPQEGQTCYLRGNYEAEKKLNGNGTNGASGKSVYVGMLAGPKAYAFGTKIYFSGLGVGTIDDRGGAIVSAGSRNMKYDRIDIWVGKGDEGLVRALNWGKRVVSGTFVGSNTSLPNLSLDAFGKAQDISTICDRLKRTNANTNNTNAVADIFSVSVNEKSKKADITELQSILTQLGYFHGQIDGIFSQDLTEAIYTFQFENDIVESYFDTGAGNYGPKTRSLLKKAYEQWKAQEQIKQETIARAKEEITDYVVDIPTISINDVSQDVRRLQKALSFLGYFKEKDTAVFGPKTKEALVQYQLDKKIISNSDSTQAGVFGPNTKNSLINDLVKQGFLQEDSGK